jgi:hypothetical protein
MQKYSFDSMQLPSRFSILSALPPFRQTNMAGLLPGSDVLAQLRNQLNLQMTADIQENKLQNTSNDLLIDKTEFLEDSNGLNGIHATSIAALRQKARTYGFPCSNK